MQARTFKYLKFIPYIGFDLWDTKRYTSKSISSNYDIVELGSCIKEENKKYKIFEEDNKEFGILGVNNKEGIFDAYLQKGKDINQAYKRMEVGWIAYNPYRINVGSIGVRKHNHKYEYISPAYVVFSCNANLLPEYLFLLFKTNVFNKVINESTTGSVRQNLTIDVLKKLKIPLPSVSEQEFLVNNYYRRIKEAENLALQANDLEDEIEKYLFEALGVEKTKQKEHNIGLRIIEYKDLDRWDCRTESEFISKYDIERIGKYIVEISTGTTPPTNRPEYFNGDINFYTPVELGKEMYLINSERKISKLAFEEKKARRFSKGTLLFVGIGSTVGKIGIVANNYATSNQQITGFKVDETILNNEFVFYYFNYFKEITTKEQTKATLPIINQDKILNIPIPIIPLQEQIKIAETITKKRNQICDKIKEMDLIKDRAEQEFENAIFS